jgi:hypothetical protein
MVEEHSKHNVEESAELLFSYEKKYSSCAQG